MNPVPSSPKGPPDLRDLARDLVHRFQFPEVDVAFIVRFVRTMHALHTLPITLDHYFQRVGLSKARFFVLVHLYHAHPDGTRISDICRMHPVSPATLTGVVDTLEKEGLVHRTACPEDRRRVNVQLTDRGVNFMNSFLPVHYRNIRQIMSSLTIPEQKTLVELLERLSSHLSQWLDSEGPELPPAGEDRP